MLTIAAVLSGKFSAPQKELYNFYTLLPISCHSLVLSTHLSALVSLDFSCPDFHRNGIIQCVTFFDSLLCMFPRFIHVSACLPFYDYIVNALYENTTFYFSIHLLTDVSMCLKPFFSSFGHVLRSGIAGSCCNSIFNILRNCQAIFRSSCPFYVPTSSVLWFSFLHILTVTLFIPPSPFSQIMTS